MISQNKISNCICHGEFSARIGCQSPCVSVITTGIIICKTLTTIQIFS